MIEEMQQETQATKIAQMKDATAQKKQTKTTQVLAIMTLDPDNTQVGRAASTTVPL